MKNVNVTGNIQSNVTTQNITERERERNMIKLDELAKLNKSDVLYFILGGFASIIFGYFIGYSGDSFGGFMLFLLIGFGLIGYGFKRISYYHKIAWQKAVERIPYQHEVRRRK